MVYVYLLVIFLRTDGDRFMPYIIDEGYTSMLECYNAGFTAKTNHPKTVAWFNCERMQIDGYAFRYEVEEIQKRVNEALCPAAQLKGALFTRDS